MVAIRSHFHRIGVVQRTKLLIQIADIGESILRQFVYSHKYNHALTRDDQWVLISSNSIIISADGDDEMLDGKDEKEFGAWSEWIY